MVDVFREYRQVNIPINVPDNQAERDEIVGNMQKVDWDSFWMWRGFALACQSPDAQTKQFVEFVDTKSHRVILEGFNGFPAGVDDTRLPRRRPEKYDFMVHCEANAFKWILHVAGVFDDVTVYISTPPCETCLRNYLVCVPNFHVRRIVYWEHRDMPGTQAILDLFKDDVKVEQFDGGVDRLLRSGAITNPLTYMFCTPQDGRLDAGDHATSYSTVKE
jgi:deoxycytidylate deaminase